MAPESHCIHSATPSRASRLAGGHTIKYTTDAAFRDRDRTLLMICLAGEINTAQVLEVEAAGSTDFRSFALQDRWMMLMAI